MIEVTLYDYLNARSSVPCYLMRPKTVGDEYCLIEKTGQTGSGKVATSTFAIQSYAPTLARAAEISKGVREIVTGMVSLGSVSKVELTGEYNFTNTQTKVPRYQAVFDITHFEN